MKGEQYPHWVLSDASPISPPDLTWSWGGLRLLDGQGNVLGPTKGYFRRQYRTVVLCKGWLTRAPE